MAIHIQPSGTAYSAGPEVQWTADSYSDITSNLSTLAGSYVVDLSTGKIYIVKNNQTVVYTKFLTTSGSGPAPVEISVLCGVSISAGQPVTISRLDGKLYPADCTTVSTSVVAGLCAASTAAGFVANVAQSSLTLTDWTAAIGSASFSVGDVYFLSTDGTMSTTATQSIGNLVTWIGIASSAQTIALNIQQPILL